MNGINELITIADRWKEWDDATLIIMVLNNGDLNEVTWEQRVLGGDPRFDDSQLLPAFPYADYARLLGLQGLRIDRPEDLGPAWEQAFDAGCPTVLEVITDPEVPPIPPHISIRQARAYLSALLQEGTTGGVALRATLKQWWAS